MLDNIIQSVGAVLIVLDSEGKIIVFNKTSELVTGYSSSEAIGLNFFDVFIREEDHRKVSLVFEDLKNKRDRSEYSNYIETKNGELRYILWKNTVIRKETGSVEYIVASGVDITQQNKMEQELQAKENLNQALINNAPFGIIIVHRKSIKYCNQVFANLVKKSMEEICGEPYDRFFPNSEDELQRNLEQLKAKPKGKKSVNSSIVSYCHNEIPVKIDMMVIDLSEGKGGLVFLEDISLQKKLQDEEKLLQQQIFYSQKLQPLKSLSGGIAHQFNNILTGIVGNLNLVEFEIDENSQLREFTKNIGNLTERAKQLVDRMQSYAGEDHSYKSQINLNILISQIKDYLTPKLSDRIQLTIELDSSLPFIEGDENQIKQIIVNMAENASEAISANNGKITIETSVEEISVDDLNSNFYFMDIKPGKYVSLKISDNGSGINGADLKQIFDPFFTTKFAGRGLGLGITHEILKHHNGSIKVESTVGLGSVFTAYLPISSGIDESKSLVSKLKKKELESQLKILIADDEKTIRMVLLRYLTNNNFQIILAEDGLEALNLVKYHENISLALLDLTMPKMNGIEVLKEIRKTKPDLPVILMSGYSDVTIWNFDEAQISGFLKKPFDLEDLLYNIRSVLKII